MLRTSTPNKLCYKSNLKDKIEFFELKSGFSHSFAAGKQTTKQRQIERNVRGMINGENGKLFIIVLVAAKYALASMLV